MENMDNADAELDINLETLQKCTYRYLQQLAKIYGLPCNFKKIHLIQLILAKRNNEHERANSIIQQIRLERQHLASSTPKKASRKRSIQNQDVSSTMHTMSLSPIVRPKQPIMYYSSELQSKLHMYRQNIYRPMQTSDRVLRSCNLMYKKPNYVDNDVVIGIIKGERSGHEFKMNYTSKVMKKRNVLGVRKQRQVAPRAAPPPQEPVTSDKSTNCFFDNKIKSLEFKQPDGKISKIKALVHKTRKDYEIFKRRIPQTMTIQDIINSNIDCRSLTNTFSNQTETFTHTSITNPAINYTSSEQSFVNNDIQNRQTQTYENTELYNAIRALENENQTNNNNACNNTNRASNNTNYASNNTNRTSKNTNRASNNTNNASNNTNRTSNNTNRASNNTNRASNNTNNASNNTNRASTSTNNGPTSTNHSSTNTESTECYSNFDLIEDESSKIEALNTNEMSTQTYYDDPIDLTDDNRKVYYHKKIRAEKVRSNRLSIQKEPIQQLPKINEVFSKFNNVNKDYSQPLFVQVFEDIQMPTPPPGPTLSLEPLFNISRQQLGQRSVTTLTPELVTITPDLTGVTPGWANITPNLSTVSPGLSAMTPAETRCTYSKNIVVHSFVQPTAYQPVGEVYYDASYTPQSSAEFPHRYSTEPVYILAEQSDPTLKSYYEGASTSNSVSSICASAEANIPQMVEDALEIISQDGDYMERMGLSGRAPCPLCAWAGGPGRREGHLREEHATEIHTQLKSEWNLTFSLGNLLNQNVWLSGVSDLNSVLYILSTKFDPPNSLKIAMSTLTSELDIKMGSITVFNKISGEPYTWQGPIQDVPTNMPFENHGDYLNLDLDTLDLVPNNILSRFSNGGTVTEADLYDVHVIVFVKIFD